MPCPIPIFPASFAVSIVKGGRGIEINKNYKLLPQSTFKTIKCETFLNTIYFIVHVQQRIEYNCDIYIPTIENN